MVMKWSRLELWSMPSHGLRGAGIRELYGGRGVPLLVVGSGVDFRYKSILRVDRDGFISKIDPHCPPPAGAPQTTT